MDRDGETSTDAGSGGDAGSDPPEDLPAIACPAEETTAYLATSGKPQIGLGGVYGIDTVNDIIGMPPGCCDTAPPTAGFNTCWGNSPMGQCGASGTNFGLPPAMAACRGLWTVPVTFDGALKYCMCMSMPNGPCYNNVRGCLACTNGTHTAGPNPTPPFHPGTGFPPGGCFVIPVAELYCYNNVGCTLAQQAALAASVACTLPGCTAWATCKAAGTC